jgi:hypothetical protein
VKAHGSRAVIMEFDPYADCIYHGSPLGPSLQVNEERLRLFHATAIIMDSVWIYNLVGELVLSQAHRVV